MNPPQLQRLASRWRWRLGLREGLFALGAAGGAAALTLAWTTSWLWLAMAAFAATLGARLALSRPWTLDAGAMARHLDRTQPELEESSALWLRPPESLTALERLQLARINTALAWLLPDDPPPGNPPRHFLRAAVWCGLSGLLLWLVVLAWTFAQDARARDQAVTVTTARHLAAKPSLAAAAPRWPRIAGAWLTITPPAYTGRPERRVRRLSTEVEEGATVAWALTLDRPVRRAALVTGEEGAGGMPLQLADNGLQLSGSRPVTAPGLYHLNGVLASGEAWNPPELYALTVNQDLAPTLRVLQPRESRTIIEPSVPAPRVSVEVLAGDDYGVGEAHLVVTVAKGSGEAVKFREQALPFDSDIPSDQAPHGHLLTRALDFGALGLEPGDELYFYVEAHDNRQPTPNRARSETRFLVLRGPTGQATPGGRGVAGVNLVPQYFRSERQLIIDTEKLIADQPAISDHDFRHRANDLGIDQQLLRLRYGQFLGEDLEQDAATDHAGVNLDPLQAVPRENTGPHAAASVAQRFLQEHAQQDREGGEAEAGGPRAAPEQPLNAAAVRKPFVDSHDTQDAATLFDRDTKSTMKDALAAMWDAEGFLRTARPPEALAPEHRALEILKAVQQSARAYVQHVGFEPAPLNVAERRLQGDVSGAPALTPEQDLLPKQDAAMLAVRQVLEDLPWASPPVRLSAESLDLLGRAEPALTAAATHRPEMYLDALQTLRRVRGGELTLSADALRPLERGLWQLLPAAGTLPDRQPDPAPALGEAYQQALQKAEVRR